MIPKTIHYCWFGKNPLPVEYQKYIESWKKYCPEFEIIEWNEDNFDIKSNQYCYEAYKAHKWAFVSDYARLKIIYDHGGIYLDTDVELVKSLRPIIEDGFGYIGFQNYEQVNTGIGFAAERNNSCIEAMLDAYDIRNFELNNGSFDLTPCPVSNTVALLHCGLRTGKDAASKVQILDRIRVLPVDYLNPQDVDTGKIAITTNTYSIHHYSGSWYSSSQSKMKTIKHIIPASLLHLRTLRISKNAVDKMERELGKQLEKYMSDKRRRISD